MIVSITICYRPDLSALRRQLDHLHGQVNTMLVINNGESPIGLAELCGELKVSLTSLGSNKGIAHAQNIGIQQAIHLGAQMVLLMDQDSEPQPGMVCHLSAALRAFPRAAAAGPCVQDMRNLKRSYFLTDTRAHPQTWMPAPGIAHQTIEAAYLIASGSLLQVRALAGIGPMRDDWFIDHIDTEWCLRARAKGWQMIGVADACLGHRLGEKMTTVWWLRERQVPHHSPLRHYYMFRNTILLVREPYVAWHWKRYHLLRLLKLFVFFLALVPQRAPRLRMMLRGLWDGMRNRTGPKI
ncbi:MAG: glycosyltransferase family 2 protein [Rhodoferax sp.]|uniref:glycosyltransferase family 2 protein n=1 Tax=Rhodoferax sp. TaxID=50421 RepID=UPI003266859C